MPTLAQPPLVGRSREVARLGALLDAAGEGRGQTLLLFGEGGVGKTRLVGAAVEHARKRGWTVAIGRAYPVETGVPFALFSDALLPIVSGLDATQLAVLTRGAAAELGTIFPALAIVDRERTSTGADPSEIKARLLWQLSQFLTRLSAKQPLLLALDNLQWADASSLELFHFIARQIPSGARIALLGTYNEAERDSNPMLRSTEQSLLRLGAAAVQRIEPLGEDDVAHLLREMFATDDVALGRFPSVLYGWTRGNPFFVEETLKSLIEHGTLRERDGRWLGWEVETLELPPTIRDALAARVARLSSDARTLANLAAVVGARAGFGTLRQVSGLPDAALVTAIEELVASRVLEERAYGHEVAYDFTHPLLQQVLYAGLGQARVRLLHATVAEALETGYGDAAVDHADELAFHYARAHAHTLEGKAVKYLTAAGRRALDRYANREAAEYLAAALEHLDREPETTGPERMEAMTTLARAHQRLGEYDAALALWTRALAGAAAAGSAAPEMADIRHRMGLACYWSGRYVDALAHYDAGLAMLGAASDSPVAVRLGLARGICLQDVGKFDDAAAEVRRALETAERVGNPVLLARVHRALMLMYGWSGAAALAREHGERTIELARESGQQMLLWSGHWGMAMVSGLTSDAPSLLEHLAAAERVAEELGSPLLPLWTAEVALEYAASAGDWETGIATGERTIALARALGQRMLLPRLLVWTGLIYLERGEPARAKEMFDEAWRTSGAAKGAERPVDIPSVVPAHFGLAAFHLATGDYAEAARIGETALALAEQAGHTVWAVQWLLPLVTQARLRSRDFDAAAAHARRLGEYAERLDHPLGRASAISYDGLLALHRDGDAGAAAPLLQTAADQLEAIPYLYAAARVRRELARALRLSGDRDGSVRELRRAHDVFARLGAAGELAQTRDELREAGVRPPSKSMGIGAAGLTSRELEIARMVAQRRANKEIGSALSISARTVSTHLSNIFAKLGVESRGELADYVREKGLLDS